MIAVIILAAGQSKRMGQPKMLLPWGKSTVIEHVIRTFLIPEIEDVVVVTGAARDQIENVIRSYPVRRIYNAEHAAGEMLSSIQCGLRGLSDQAQAVLIGLGDQPQVQEQNVRLICQAYRESQAKLIVPSFQRRRGHPWLVARSFWDELLGLKSPESPRDFMNRHANEIRYVNVETGSILADLDTPDDYQRSRPGESSHSL